MGTVMPIITGVLEGRMGFLIVALAVVMIVLVSLIIIQRINLKKRKAEINQKVLLDSLFPDENLRKAIARNLGTEVSEPIAYKALETITDLQAEYAEIADITGVSHLPNLSILSLTNNALKALPNEIAELKNLTELKLAYNDINNLEPIYKSEHLQMLDISGNKLKKLPEELFTLPEFSKLIAINCDLEELPEDIGLATKMKEINVGHNELKALPESIGQLADLEKLIVNNNELNSLPTSLASNTALKELSLAANALEEIPEQVQVLMKNNGIPIPKLEAEEQELEQPLETSIEKIEKVEDNTEVTQQEKDLGEMEEVLVNTKVNTFIDLTSSNDNLLADLEALEKGKDFFAETTATIEQPEPKKEPLKVAVEQPTLVDELSALEEVAIEKETPEVIEEVIPAQNPIERFKNMDEEEKAKFKKIAKITGGIAAVGAVVIGGTYLILSGEKKKASPFNKKKKGFFER